MEQLHLIEGYLTRMGSAGERRSCIMRIHISSGEELQMAKQPQIDHGILSAALSGLEFEKSRLDATIAEIKAELGQPGPGRPQQAPTDGAEKAAPKRGGMSAAGKRRIAAAQRKRWAALKASQAEPKKSKRKKRKMSAAGRARIIAATKKRWAAYHKAKAKA